MVINTKEPLAIALLGAIAGLSTAYWLQAVINDKSSFKIVGVEVSSNAYLGMHNDPTTFALSLVTSVAAITAILMVIIRDRNRCFSRLVSGTVGSILGLWVVLLVLYCLREDDLGKETSHVRKRDIVRSVIYIVLALLSGVFLSLAGIY